MLEDEAEGAEEGEGGEAVDERGGDGRDEGGDEVKGTGEGGGWWEWLLVSVKGSSGAVWEAVAGDGDNSLSSLFESLYNLLQNTAAALVKDTEMGSLDSLDSLMGSLGSLMEVSPWSDVGEAAENTPPAMVDFFLHE
jgi:hypothetical protein